MKKILFLFGIACLPVAAVAAESDVNWRFFTQAAYLNANAGAPAGSEYRNTFAIIDGVNLNRHRNDLFDRSNNALELQFGYGKKNRHGFYLGGAYINTGKQDMKDIGSVIGGSNIVGAEYDIQTSATYYDVYIAYHISYPKVANWVFYHALDIITFGGGGLALSFMNPSFYLDLGPELTFSKLKYSGDLNADESHFGLGMHLGIGAEFNISKDIIANIGYRHGFSLSQFLSQNDGFARISGLRVGLKYYF
ncbi:MAG: porin family protein [Rickettsiales bacterium]|jgi:opacity protein-like surface antigen|nr:porin family protein [Rickettsiales bacterium]